MFPEHVPTATVYHVTVWLGDQCTISLGCEAVAISEATAIIRGRATLAGRFPELADVIAYGPSRARPMHTASDGELLAARIKPQPVR